MSKSRDADNATGHDHAADETLPPDPPIADPPESPEPDPSINPPPEPVNRTAPPEFYAVHGLLSDIVTAVGRIASRMPSGMGDDIAALKRKLEALWDSAHGKK